MAAPPGDTPPATVLGVTARDLPKPVDADTGELTNPPALVETAIASRLSAHRSESLPDERRYQVRGVIGQGATSRVFAIYDHNLQRSVALKVLLQGGGATAEHMTRFIHEAAVTASLDHPNVPPVYELNLAADGAVFYTMKQVEGRSLGAAINAWADGSETVPPFSDILGVIIRVANAVEAAHARGLVHRDIKPDNIMLGRFGEVFLVDWGTAHSPSGESASGRRVGTPFYMSPEAANGAIATPADDVYSLGATLFAALLLRPPLAAAEPEIFWTRKIAGTLDLPSVDERRRVPPQLIAIAVKALSAKAADRYADASALRRDLEHWLAGDSISAWRESPWERLRRWHRHHGRALWRWTAAALVIAGLLAALYGERLKEVATWGKPILHERFADESWKTRWVIADGAVEQRDGRLVTTAEGPTHLDLSERQEGPIAIEYTGELLPDSAPCDISFIYNTASHYESSTVLRPSSTRYLVQIGAYDGSYSAIIISGEARFEHLAYSDFRPRPGQRYRVRIEIVDRDLIVRIDGREILHYIDPLPFTGGFITLYGYYPGKAFSDICIYSQGLPQRQSATAVGDAFTRVGDLAHAREQYARIAKLHGDGSLGQEARFKLGQLLESAGNHSAADAAWNGLSDPGWRNLARLERLERMVAQSGDDAVFLEVEDLYRNGGSEVRQRLTLAWNRWIVALRRGPQARTESWLALRERVFPNELVTEFVAAETLLDLDRPQEVLDRFPAQHQLGCLALSRLGRSEEILDRFPEQRWQAAQALLGTGQSELIATRYPEQKSFILRGLVRRGRLAEADALAGPSGYPAARLAMGRYSELVDNPERSIAVHALLLAGRGDAALVKAADDGDLRIVALMSLNRLAEARALADDGRLSFLGWVTGTEATTPTFRNDAQPGIQWLATWKGPVFSSEESFRMTGIVLPAALAALGQTELYDRSLAILREHRWDLEQHPRYVAGFLLCDLDESTFLSQPHNLFAPADLLLLRGIRNDHLGFRAKAIADYTAWLALPVWQRSTEPEPVIEEFARWRIAALAR